MSTLKIPAKFEIVSISPLIIVDSTHTPIAINTVCDALAEFRDQMGESIRLCLPDDTLASQYVRALTERQYNIESVLVPDTVLDPNVKPTLTERKAKKAFIKKCLLDLNNNTVLIVSGDYPFVNPIRYELLATMGF